MELKGLLTDNSEEGCKIIWLMRRVSETLVFCFKAIKTVLFSVRSVSNSFIYLLSIFKAIS